MWDEQERFSKVVSIVAISLLGVLGLALAVATLATGDVQFLFAFFALLGTLAAFVLVYGLVAMCAGGILFCVTGMLRRSVQSLRALFSARSARK